MTPHATRLKSAPVSDSDSDKRPNEDDSARESAPAQAAEPGLEGASPALLEGGERDEAAARVAAALGLEDAAPADAAADGAEPAVALNRAARRREEALARQRKRAGEPEPVKSADEELPKDRNARAKELLKRRREQASEGLLPSELVDDALARSSSAFMKWLRTNWKTLQWVIVGGLGLAGLVMLYVSHTEKTAAAATGSLYGGVSAERGRVMAEDKRSDDEKEIDPTQVFKTAEERQAAALEAYDRTISAHGDSVVGLLAKLGKAGVLLQKREHARAAELFEAVAGSKLAGTDPDVKGRALEGLGLARESAGDLDAALAAFQKLDAITAPGFKELGLYQQGRIVLAKGDKERAKTLLKQAREKLQAPSAEGSHPYRYLEQVVDETLRRIDPSLVPTPAPVLGGPKGGSLSPEEIDKIRRMVEQAGKKGGEGSH